ncbi:MAG: tRNA (adenosine(37)-N6)-threonylcarbamoyltransferase complex ATPase subunit type 1 TsaE [Patescibacteria group bacterium]
MISRSFEDTKQFAKDLILAISKKTSDRATVLDLKGDLGAGKTVLVQMIGRELGVTETMQSPTFVIMKSYKTTNPRFKTLVHIDAYRIENIEEIKILRLEEVFADPLNFVCIEWAEKIKEIIPEEATKINCTLLENDEHQYEMQD